MYEPRLYHGTHGPFCRGTPILVNLDKSPEVDELLSKSGSRINNHLFTYALYCCISRTDFQYTQAVGRVLSVTKRSYTVDQEGSQNVTGKLRCQANTQL